MYHALLVEDDRDLSLITQMNQKHVGYEVDVAYCGTEALELLTEKKYDLILLDAVLPDRRGDELCGLIRDTCTCPIIFMSCLDDSKTIVKALHSGEDDYMAKPISFDEMLARSQAVIRRSKVQDGVASGKLRRFKEFTIDSVHRRVLRGEEEIGLSSIEYAILCFMCDHPDELLLYQQIYESVWDSDSLGDVRTVMVHISNLRKKIDCDHRGIIKTVRGAGYIFSNI